jgi:hypothetical protein
MEQLSSTNNERIEITILRNFFYNEGFTRKTLPFVKPDYFTNRIEKLLYEEIENFVHKYKNLPTKESILIEISRRKDINEEELKLIKELVTNFNDEKSDLQWLLDTTEKFCKDRAVHNAVLSGIKILDGKDKQTLPEAIPGILSEALAVSFDNHIGHDYIADAESRFDWYHTKEKRYPEMAEERIAERIDANLMDVTMDDLHDMPKQLYDNKMTKLRGKTTGKLIIKEYPTASAHSGHFRGLLNELALKKSFKPDIVFIDYLNICASSRFKGGNISSYFYIKAIAEELRGLAVEFNFPIFSATQTTRTGFVSTDIGLEDTSESFGLPATADFMFALMSNEELESLGQMKVKQLKNRYNDPTMNKSFIIGVDRSKMRLYDVENAAQNIVDSNQTKEKENYPTPEQAYDKFSDFKV